MILLSLLFCRENDSPVPKLLECKVWTAEVKVTTFVSFSNDIVIEDGYKDEQKLLQIISIGQQLLLNGFSLHYM